MRMHPGSVLGTDRRKHARAPLSQSFRGPETGLTGAVHILDVSEGGARLRMEGGALTEEEITLQLTLPSRTGTVATCDVLGQVVRRQGAEIGVRFDRLLPRHFLQLRDFVWREGMQG